jgi:hypothetical protein
MFNVVAAGIKKRHVSVIIPPKRFGFAVILLGKEECSGIIIV